MNFLCWFRSCVTALYRIAARMFFWSGLRSPLHPHPPPLPCGPTKSVHINNKHHNHTIVLFICMIKKWFMSHFTVCAPCQAVSSNKYHFTWTNCLVQSMRTPCVYIMLSIILIQYYINKVLIQYDDIQH